IGLRDPGGFTEEVVLLPIPALDIVSLFDGERSVAEIHEIVQARHGRAAPAPEDIARFAERLDEAGFLQSLGFEARRQAIEEAWLAGPSRPAAHAGGAYADDPDALKVQIDGFFVNGDGPGWPAPRPGAPKLRGLIAPHIDFHRGGPTYGWAYRALVERSDADLFVVLGTCPAGMPDPFAATLKPYDAPLGLAARARRGGRRFLRAAGPALRPRPPRLAGSASQRALDRVPGGDAPAAAWSPAVHDPARAHLVPPRGDLDGSRRGGRSPSPAFSRGPRRDDQRVGAARLRRCRCRPRPRGAALRRRGGEHRGLSRARRPGGREDAGGGDGIRAHGVLRLRRCRRRQPPYLRPLSHLRFSPRAARHQGRAPPL